jgi:hypothetical protein
VGAVPRDGTRRPFLFLLSDHGGNLLPADSAILDAIRSAAARDSLSRIVTIPGTHHFSFSDATLRQSRILRSLLVALGGPGGGLDTRTALSLTARHVREFLGTRLSTMAQGR